MKKLSLLSLFGLTGLLAFIATPIYAQDVEDVINETVDVVNETVDNTIDAVDDVTDETVGAIDEVIDETEDVVNEVTTGGIEDFNSLFENEEVKNALMGLDLTNEEELLAGAGTGLLLVLGIVGLILWILRIIALWKAFERAGEGGWKAIIPVYCTYIKYKLAGMKNWFWYALLIALILGIIAACVSSQEELLSDITGIITGIIHIVMTFKFARKYGWGVFTSILFVLFYPICILILGFGNFKYLGKSEETVVEA